MKRKALAESWCFFRLKKTSKDPALPPYPNAVPHKTFLRGILLFLFKSRLNRFKKICFVQNTFSPIPEE
ncbi:MAG: hypothetical protein AAF765_08760 [Bacteroidota bacterium]